MKKTNDPEDEPTYQKRNRLQQRRAPLKAKERLKADQSGFSRVPKAIKRRRAKAPKKKGVTALKKHLDIAFGRFVKMRDGHMVDRQWIVPCITCHKEFVYRDIDGRRYTNIQAGHFMGRALNATRYEEKNVNGQCTYCNKWLAGDQYNHGLEIDKKYGAGTSTALYEQSRSEFKLKAEWLQEKLDYYREAIDKWERLWDNHR